jgi:CheY-specific phosphatase CheX
VTTKREVLCIDSGLGSEMGRLAHLHEHIKELDFHMIATSDTSWLAAYLKHTEPLAAIIVDGNVLTEIESNEILAEVRGSQPDVPICWLRSSSTLMRHYRPDLPDKSLELEGTAEQQVKTINDAIKKRYFPRIIAYAMEFSTRLSIKQSFHLNFEERPSYLRSSYEPLAEISGMMSFYGHETNGSVVVSGSPEVMKACCEHILPNAPSSATTQEQDVAGDMCNAIVGRLKGFLEQNGTRIQNTWPITTKGYPMSLAFGSGRISLVQNLSSDKGQLFVELYLDSFDALALRRNVRSRSINTGELKFF